ncbi:MAG: TonB family protein, partial [Candidatus Acidiferrum sp.]
AKEKREILQATADGKVTDPVVLRSPGMGLDRKAVSHMGKWQMKPALGPDGKPVDCRVQIEVTFKIYQDASRLNDAKGVAGVCIDRVQSAALQLGYQGLFLGQEAYVTGTKTPNPVVGSSGCVIEDLGASPALDEQFLSIAGSAACVVNTGKDGRVNRIVVASRTSVAGAIEMLTQKYGQPLTGLYRVVDKGPVDATLWAWQFPAETGSGVIKPSISVEPKVRTRQGKDGYAPYVEIIFQE